MEELIKFKKLLQSELTDDIKYELLVLKPNAMNYFFYQDVREFMDAYDNWIIDDYSNETKYQLIHLIEHLIPKYQFIESVRKSVVWLSNRPAGGQHAGIDSSVILQSVELSTTIHIGCNRSQLKNRNMALKLFEVALEEYCNEQFKYKPL